MIRAVFSALLLTLITATPAFALDLVTAKAQGLVGETPAGLLEVVNPPASPDVQALITGTNTGRMKIYLETARKQNVPVEQVQAVSGAALIDKTPAGQFVKTASGAWVKK